MHAVLDHDFNLETENVTIAICRLLEQACSNRASSFLNDFSCCSRLEGLL